MILRNSARGAVRDYLRECREHPASAVLLVLSLLAFACTVLVLAVWAIWAVAAWNAL